jgi:hypothetical protein
MRKVRLVLLALAGAACLQTGCGPISILTYFFMPAPVPAWVAERMEDKYCHKNDFRTPIMPPIRPGFPPPMCEDAPDDARVLRAMIPITRGVFYVYEEFRDNYRIVKERIVDKIDPPRFFPVVGPAQLHHCHWKCTIYYTETIVSAYPFPFKCVKPRVEVVWMDLDHLHLYPCPTPENQRSVTHDTAGY